MTVQQNIVPLKDLNLTHRFLFDEVMEDFQAHQDALSIILGRNIPLLNQNETEKEMRVSPALRSIRMDVFSMDEDNVVYNTEMQGKRKPDLAKRSRYYQALLDTGLLEPGIPTYNLLNDSYIITITPFDIFGYKRYQYTFRAKCEEESACLLGDGATRIFLNTRGTNDGEVSKELVQFLHYLENTTDVMAANTDSDKIKRIHNRVCKVKASEKVGVKYMQAWEEKYFELEEARKESLELGLEQGLELGLSQGRTEGINALIEDNLEENRTEEQIIAKLVKRFSLNEEVAAKYLYEYTKSIR